MFDFGFSELLVIGVVALIVIGPERLPRVARTVGHILGRMQRYVSDVKSDIQREIQLDELKKLQQQVQDQAREFETSVRQEMAGVEAQIGKVAADIQSPAPVADSGVPDAGVQSEGISVEGVSAAQADEPEKEIQPAPQLELGLTHLPETEKAVEGAAVADKDKV